MYSLGIVLFELFHPFSTDMERVRTLTSLREGGLENTRLGDDIHQTVLQLTHPEPGRRPTAEMLVQVLFLGRGSRF